MVTNYTECIRLLYLVDVFVYTLEAWALSGSNLIHIHRDTYSLDSSKWKDRVVCVCVCCGELERELRVIRLANHLRLVPFSLFLSLFVVLLFLRP